MNGFKMKIWIGVVALIGVAIFILSAETVVTANADEFGELVDVQVAHALYLKSTQSQLPALQDPPRQANRTDKCVAVSLGDGTQTFVCTHSLDNVVDAQLVARGLVAGGFHLSGFERDLCDFDAELLPLVANCAIGLRASEKLFVRLRTNTGTESYLSVTVE